MKAKWKNVLLLLTIASVLMLILVGGFGCFHPGFILNIGNNFPQTVNVYFNGDKVGAIRSGGTKTFWPYEKIENDKVLIELKSTSGQLLYSKIYTWDDISKISQAIHADPYWIGTGTQVSTTTTNADTTSTLTATTTISTTVDNLTTPSSVNQSEYEDVNNFLSEAKNSYNTASGLTPNINGISTADFLNLIAQKDSTILIGNQLYDFKTANNTDNIILDGYSVSFSYDLVAPGAGGITENVKVTKDNKVILASIMPVRPREIVLNSVSIQAQSIENILILSISYPVNVSMYSVNNMWLVLCKK